MALLDIDLDDRYAAGPARALMTGTQAIVRLLAEQRRLDASRGLDTGAFISGYPGSPLAGLDREVARAMPHLGPLGVVFEAAVNEELAATAVGGTQLVGELPGRRRDGVAGFWFGKAPGLDRAADAIRHANTSGTSHLGGAVALIGDDPQSKSSTLASSSELMAESLVLPLFSPATVADLVRLGLHAVALSREAGLWTAMKVIADVADAAAGVDVSRAAAGIPLPPALSRGAPPVLLGPASVAAEHDLLSTRLERARAYGRDHRLNRVVFEPSRPRVALVAPGPSFATLRSALRSLALEDADLDALGLRLVALDLVWPLHPDDVATFADGVEEIIVVEDKRPFVERQLRDLLYGTPDAPRVLGKRDEAGRELISSSGAVEADALARALGRRWADRLPEASRAAVAAAGVRVRDGARALPMARTPFFCSGCPHARSTRTGAEQLVGAGIGCHALIALDPAAERGHVLGAPQMGGEGAQWLGMRPFTDDAHYVQNLGDGTFHHSGSLAIRAAVAAGAHMTYRLLYNDAVAMTGGQRAPGRISVVDLTHWLALEGVARVAITSEDPDSFAGQTLAPGTTVHEREALEVVEAQLAAVPGVTVLIHTDRCATEERRLRKRGKLPEPAQRVWINERVCEGCGDCGATSSCLSVIPVETDLGRKTQIHQSSCTQDASCVEGDCPSFVVVTPAGGHLPGPPPAPPLPVALTEPVPRFAADQGVLVRMPGIGGTGVLTVSQLLQMAALLEDRWSAGLDQTGLAQKGGAVISDVRIGPAEPTGTLRASGGEVDVLLGLDLLGCVTADTLRTLDPARTVAVVNLHRTPTAAMVLDPDAPPLPLRGVVARLEASTRAADALWLDAGWIAEQLFADHMPANVVLLGAALQHGCLPVGVEALEEAIRLNGAAVETNLVALAWGRAAAIDAAAVTHALAGRGAQPSLPERPAPPAVAAALDATGIAGPPRARVARLATELCAYQGVAYAERFVHDVAEVAAIERAALGGAAQALTAAYAGGLFKLMAYKDEYEVARLHLDAVEQARRAATFGPGASAEILVHPPVLRALGMRRKLRLRRSAVPLFKALHAARGLRGTRLDPFGRAEVRRVERALVDEYRAAVRIAAAALTPETADDVNAVAALPDMVRGYEQIKLANVARYRTELNGRLERLGTAA